MQNIQNPQMKNCAQVLHAWTNGEKRTVNKRRDRTEEEIDEE
jgi:hypothetical protein